ncbi:Peptidyl-prolyl cis-trans isomerase [hydrothermal vent metagenome]|uniref:peptidylprolyl isomerase n=1 Tax=hydrothermal vent metagenome TaxID=652676 RepID=A0A3B0QQ12_9ZZZZ
MRGLARVLAVVLFFGFVAVLSPALSQAEGGSLTPKELKKLSKVTATIETKYGKMKIKFFPDKAPNHVKNFIKLAEDGFYDGTLFHRVVPGFVIQGGDPNTKGANTMSYGTGGPGYTLDAEFNDIPHVKGILSMARGRGPNTAGSQFFIVVGNASGLDGQYTVFGELTSGVGVLETIVALPRDTRDIPRERVEMKVIIKK